MYKLIEPFKNGKIYYNNKKDTIRDIYRDLRYFDIKNVKITIKDIKTGSEYSYFIIDKKNNKIKI